MKIQKNNIVKKLYLQQQRRPLKNNGSWNIKSHITEKAWHNEMFSIRER